MSKQKTKKYNDFKMHHCKMCKTEKIREAGICKLCAKSLAIATNLLQDLGFESGESELWEIFMGAVFAMIKERRDVIKKVTGELVSFSALALLEATEVKLKHREPANYILHMSPENAKKVFFFDSNGRMPTDEELASIKSNVEE